MERSDAHLDVDDPATATGDGTTLEDAATAAGRDPFPYPKLDPHDPALRPLGGLFRKHRPLKPVQHEDPEKDELAQQRIAAERHMGRVLKGVPPVDHEPLLAQMREGYQEQDRRGDRAERRATTLLSSITIITGIVGATSTIAASSDVFDDAPARLALGGAVVGIVVSFGAAARWALLVITIQDHWRRTATPKMLRARVRHSGAELFVHTVAAYYDSTAWNQAIADYRARRLFNASRCFAFGLVLLLVTVALFAGASMAFPVDDEPATTGTRGPAGTPGAAGRPGAPGPPGRTVVNVVRPRKVRVALASGVLRAAPGDRLQVRYAVTNRSVVTVSVRRGDRDVTEPVSKPAGFGPNATTVKAPGRGRYVVLVAARAANGTATSAAAVLVVR